MAKTFICTVEQAVKDGKYIDCTETAKRAEYLIPVYVASGVWKQCDCDDPAELWDLLQYARDEIQKKPSRTIDFHYRSSIGIARKHY